MQVARRVQDERRIKHRESKRGEDLDEEQGRGSFGNIGEPVFPAFVCRFQSFRCGLMRKGIARSYVIEQWPPDCLNPIQAGQGSASQAVSPWAGEASFFSLNNPEYP